MQTAKSAEPDFTKSEQPRVVMSDMKLHHTSSLIHVAFPSFIDFDNLNRVHINPKGVISTDMSSSCML